jgi:voltage-gated potassium channel
VPFVVIDQREDLEDLMRYDGVAYLIGASSSESVLRAGRRGAGPGPRVRRRLRHRERLHRAHRPALNPDIFIVARAGKPESPDRLLRAGANRVISPYVTSGRHMAVLAVRPEVSDYLDVEGAGGAVRIEQLAIEPGSELAGRSVGEVCGESVPVLLRRANGDSVPNPGREERCREGDIVVSLGQVGHPTIKA